MPKNIKPAFESPAKLMLRDCLPLSVLAALGVSMALTAKGPVDSLATETPLLLLVSTLLPKNGSCLVAVCARDDKTTVWRTRQMTIF